MLHQNPLLLYSWHLYYIPMQSAFSGVSPLCECIVQNIANTYKYKNTEVQKCKNTKIQLTAVIAFSGVSPLCVCIVQIQNVVNTKMQNTNIWKYKSAKIQNTVQWLHFRECPRYASGSPGAWPPLTETATDCSHYTINHDHEEEEDDAEEDDDDEEGDDNDNEDEDSMQRMLHVKWQEVSPPIYSKYTLNAYISSGKRFKQ